MRRAKPSAGQRWLQDKLYQQVAHGRLDASIRAAEAEARLVNVERTLRRILGASDTDMVSLQAHEGLAALGARLRYE